MRSAGPPDEPCPGPLAAGKYRFTATSDSGATFNSTGSAQRPGHQVETTIDFEFPNVSGRRLPETMSTLPLVSPMLAAPIRTGFVPNSFDSRILTLLPPMLTRTILANGLVRKARWHNATRRLWTGRPSADPGSCNCWDGRMDAKGSYNDCTEDGALRKQISLHPALPAIN